MRNVNTAQLVLGFFAFSWFSISSAQTSVIGPLEQLSPANNQITVLGQTFLVDKDTVVVAQGKNISRALLGKYAGLRRVVSIQSTPAAGSKRAASIRIDSEVYVAGATAVAVSGVVDALSLANGTVRIGGLTIDTSALPPVVVEGLQLGAAITVAGLQPSPGGTLLGQLGESGAQSLSIGGTGIQSIGGTEIQSIGGTGVQSIGGTGVQSIGGTGVQSIGGTGVQSIGGTGVQSIGGTGIQSIGGTGIRSIGGTGKMSIGGTGAH